MKLFFLIWLGVLAAFSVIGAVVWLCENYPNAAGYVILLGASLGMATYIWSLETAYRG